MWERVKKEKWAYIFLLPAVTIFFIFNVLPAIASLGFGFLNFGMRSVSWAGLDNFKYLFSDDVFWRALRNTTIFSVCAVSLGVGVSLLLGTLIFSLPNKRVQVFLKSGFYLPSVCSVVATSLVWLYLYDPSSGLFNYVLGKIGLQPVNWLGDMRYALPSIIFMYLMTTQGPTLLILLAGLGNIPTAFYEVAQIDGAGRWIQFCKITLPLLRPILLYVIMINTVFSFRVFTQIYMMTGGGPYHASTTLVYELYRIGFQRGQWGIASALGMFLVFLLVPISIIQYKILYSKTTEY